MRLSDEPSLDQPESTPRRRSRRLRLRRLGPTGVWPTMFTLGNLVAGFAAIHFATRPMAHAADAMGSGTWGPWEWSNLTVASALILLGVIFDSVDGSVARLTDSVTEMGGQLDSLADLVTFGLAPAFITLHLLSQYVGVPDSTSVVHPAASNLLGRLSWTIAAIFVCCAALRLARYNVETASGRLGSPYFFRGLPAPGAAGAVIGIVVLHEHMVALAEGATSGFAHTTAVGLAFALPVIVLVAAAMMVSTLPYPHLANRYLRVRRPFAYLVRAAIVLCFAVLWLQETIAAVFLLYLCSGPFNRARGQRYEPAEEA